MAYEYITRWFYPKEANHIAGVYEQKAARVYELAAQLERIKGTLESTWEGRSKIRFMPTIDDMPSRLRAYAEELRARAREIRAIQVSETIRQWIPDPEPADDKNSGGGGGHRY